MLSGECARNTRHRKPFNERIVSVRSGTASGGGAFLGAVSVAVLCRPQERPGVVVGPVEPELTDTEFP